MIYLKTYQQFNKPVAFDPSTGEAVATAPHQAGFSGFVATLPNGQLAALYKQAEGMVLQIARQRWVNGSAVRTQHQYLDGGKTLFALYQYDKEEFSCEYPSWWTTLDTHLPPALGELANDEEDDFLGFVHSVFEDEKKGIPRGGAWRNA